MTSREQLIAWHARWAEVNAATERAARRSSPADAEALEAPELLSDFARLLRDRRRLS